MSSARRIALEHRIHELPTFESGWAALELLEDINTTSGEDRVYLLDLMVRSFLGVGSPVPER